MQKLVRTHGRSTASIKVFFTHATASSVLNVSGDFEHIQNDVRSHDIFLFLSMGGTLDSYLE